MDLPDEVMSALRREASDVDARGAWPATALDAMGRAGVFRYFVPEAMGGATCSEAERASLYMELASACLTSAFVLTQRSAACRWIARGPSLPARDRLLAGLAEGGCFATVGVSHLSTSRRHLGRPSMTARRVEGGYVLDGQTAWVTGAAYADVLVTGAELDEGQIMVCVPREAFEVGPAMSLLALTGSSTAAVRLDGARISEDQVLVGPGRDLMGVSRTGGTAGVHTSCLAMGLALAALRSLEHDAVARPELQAVVEPLVTEWLQLRRDLFAFVEGDERDTKYSLRQRANALVLESTRCALRASKGAGFLSTHAVGRWCREALFFSVWSVPSEWPAHSRAGVS